MLNQSLIDVLNSGNAWAFVGSGASVDAGHPRWSELPQMLLKELAQHDREGVESDARYQKAIEKGDYPAAAGRIEALVGRGKLDECLRLCFKTTVKPGALTKLITDIPFQAYVTTNYDHLLERSLKSHGGGWITVGNHEDELRKVAPGVSNIVWHVHGAFGRPEDSSLVLTEADYDRTYLEDTPLVQKMREVLAQRRLVFIGFGFGDPELMRILKRVAAFASPATPAFAFLDEQHADEPTRQELLERFNVVTISYAAPEGQQHQDLADSLETYAAMTVRRSVKFAPGGYRETKAERHDPETTGLLLYNKLCLEQPAGVGQESLSYLARALILALLHPRKKLGRAQLVQAVVDRTQLFAGRASPDVEAAADRLVTETVEALERTGTIEAAGPDQLQLSATGAGEVAEHSAAAERMEQQFRSSLEERMEPHRKELGEGELAAIAHVAADFLEECVSRKALGVALAFMPRQDRKARQYQVDVLLRDLPRHMKHLGSHRQARVLIDLVRDVLSGFAEVEAKYLGTALQAKFGVHLLGLDPDGLRARAAELSRTVFLIDANTLIPLLATASQGHEAATLLLDRIKRVGACPATTELLAEEVAEHARWAMAHSGEQGLLMSGQTYTAYTGRTAPRMNGFLEGAVAEMGTTGGTVRHYLRRVLGPPGASGKYRSRHVVQKLRDVGIHCEALSSWEGGNETLLETVRRWKEGTERRRRRQDTFTHDRQVRAEAEAATIVTGLREGTLLVNGQRMSAAYFVSNTKAVEPEDYDGPPITMRLSSALQWLATLTPLDPEEMGVLSQLLLLDLSLTGKNFVDSQRVGLLFGPLLVAAKERLDEQVAHHATLIAERFGEHGLEALRDVEPADAPVVLLALESQVADVLQRRLVAQQDQNARLMERVKRADQDQDELERLRAGERRRKEKAASRQRAANSRPKKRRRKRKDD